MTKVVAVNSRADTRYAGYDGEKRRVHGEVFEWPEGVKMGSWVQPVGDPLPEPRNGITNAEKVATRGMTLKEASTPLELPSAPKKSKKSH
jgi:hypothetical protein